MVLLESRLAGAEAWGADQAVLGWIPVGGGVHIGLMHGKCLSALFCSGGLNKKTSQADMSAMSVHVRAD